MRLPFVIGGQIPAFKDLIVYPPAYFQLLKLNLKTETTVTAINTKDKTVTAVDNTGNVTILPYDKLVIATGGYAFMPPIKGGDKSGIYTLRTEDGEKSTKVKVVQTAVIMSWTYRIETGVALVERIKATIEMLPQIS